MISGTPKVAHSTIKTFRFTFATSPAIDAVSNFRKEPNVNMNVATARQGRADAANSGTPRPMTTPAMTMRAPFAPAQRRMLFIASLRFRSRRRLSSYKAWRTHDVTGLTGRSAASRRVGGRSRLPRRKPDGRPFVVSGPVTPLHLSSGRRAAAGTTASSREFSAGAANVE